MGACLHDIGGVKKTSCQIALKYKGGLWYRLIYDIVLSRPEDYLSIYMSMCNHRCLKCHSWYFTQIPEGKFLSTEEIALRVKEYEEKVTVFEPRRRATMWHASDLCRHCGMCKLRGVRGPLCPRKLSSDKIVYSPQGFGPARNIVAYTGGDLACRVEFYAQLTEKIKEQTKRMWVLFETNGYGLTRKNLDILRDAGLDSFWLDIKAYSEDKYKKLCGVTNKWILKVPEWILERDFVLEVSTVYIPSFIEVDEIKKIARLLADIDENIPYMIIAFIPEFRLLHLRPPTLKEMIDAYEAAKSEGLRNVKLGNISLFVKTREDLETLIECVGLEAIG